MKIKYVSKLWQGRYVSVRDYEVKQALSKGGLEINHDGHVMQIFPEELLKLAPNSRVIQSKFTGTDKVVDILFKPLTDDPRQQDLNF